MLLVTGASGLLGSNIVQEALSQGFRVRAASRQRVSIPGAESVVMRLEDTEFDGLMRGGVRRVVHCAAMTDVDKCQREPGTAMRLNAKASGEIASAARRVGAAFVYVSTDAVYGGSRGGWTEDDVPAPANSYAASKLAGEHAVLSNHPNALLVRTNLFGWNLYDRLSLGEWALRELAAGKRIRGLTDVYFSPLEARHLAGVLLEMVEAGCRGVFNLGAADGCSKFVFLRLVAVAFGYDASLVEEAALVDMPFFAPRPRDTRLDSSRATAVLGRTMPTIEDGVRRFWGGAPHGWPKERCQS